jgi:hypothetical protein
MAIIEYLTQQETAVGDDRASFTVNNAVPRVQIIPGIAAGYLRSSLGFRYFAPDDNVRLLSLGIFLPYSFTLATRGARLEAYWDSSRPASGVIDELTGPNALSIGSVEVPFDGAEFPLDVVIAHKDSGYKVAFRFTFIPVPGVPDTATYVSMANVPAIIPNGTVLYPSVFVKVLHTLTMVAG